MLVVGGACLFHAAPAAACFPNAESGAGLVQAGVLLFLLACATFVLARRKGQRRWALALAWLLNFLAVPLSATAFFMVDWPATTVAEAFEAFCTPFLYLCAKTYKEVAAGEGSLGLVIGVFLFELALAALFTWMELTALRVCRWVTGKVLKRRRLEGGGAGNVKACG